MQLNGFHGNIFSWFDFEYFVLMRTKPTKSTTDFAHFNTRKEKNKICAAFDIPTLICQVVQSIVYPCDRNNFFCCFKRKINK